MYWRKKGKSEVLYCSEVIRLDIETAWNHDEENPITWMVSARVMFDGESQLFRRPTELMKWYNSLVIKYKLTFLKRIVTIIHNASYDLSYLLPYIQEYLPKERPYGLFDSPNKIITYRQGCFEWRCTYRLTNQSLAKWSEDMAVEHPKKIGFYDYSKIMFQDSKLSRKEDTYGLYDVMSMGEAWENQLKLYKDDVTSVPLTATGYIRRVLRKAAKRDTYYRTNYFEKNRLDLKEYDMCLGSFSGGYVHVNKNLKNYIVDEDVMKEYGCDYGVMRDFRSQYPKHLMQGLLPVGKPVLWYDIKDPICRSKMKINLDNILDLWPRYSSITRLKLYGVELKDPDFSMPILQFDKLENKSEDFNCSKDNGRITKIYSGSCSVLLDNHTLKIFKKQYRGKCLIEKVLIFKNGYLPECLQNPINDLFLKKSELKKKYFDCIEKYGYFDNSTIDAKKNLDTVKKLLNSCFGCFCTKPIKINYAINESGKMSDDWRRAELDEYYRKRSNFLAYQIGIFVPALAKAELFDYMELIGFDKVLYCDTDSIYYMSNDEIERRIEEKNREKEAASKFVIDRWGNKILYEAFEVQEKFKAFKGLHSKCYGVVTAAGELKVTIAGVPERTLIGMDGDIPIYMTREQELSGFTRREIKSGKTKERDPMECLDKLDYAFTFKVNTGVRVRYVKRFPGIAEVDGHKVETAGGCIVIPLPEKIIKDIDKIIGFDYVVEFGDVEGVIDID